MSQEDDVARLRAENARLRERLEWQLEAYVNLERRLRDVCCQADLYENLCFRLQRELDDCRAEVWRLAHAAT